MFGSAYQPLAIVGMACRLPGANNLAEYWRMLIEGRSAIDEIPAERFDQELYYDPSVGTPGKSYSKLAAVLANRDFHRDACPIDEQLEKSADITHLMMCETAATALKQADMDPFDLPSRNVGVYIGHVHGSSLIGDYTYATFIEEAAQFLHDVDDFQRLPQNERQAVIKGLIDRVHKSRPLPSANGLNLASSMAAGVIAKAFGLSGPFLSLDSACASSLQALLFAARSLQTGQTDMAIVGGASDCKPNTLILFSYARALSATGSRPFDADADGMICAEGYVSIVVKTLDRALADGDPIQAVIRGLGVSSDGRGKSLWAPRKEGQIKAMQRAYGADVDISSLQYIEAHGTATQVGDATELQTLADILTPHMSPGEKIPIGSVKANIGHTLESAGIASLIKTVLSLQQGLVPPIVNLRNLNPKVDWDSAPFYVPTTSVPLPAARNGQPRRAGVNAFGIGGLNMHVLLEEFEESKRGQALVSSLPASSVSVTTNRITKDAEDAVAVVGMGCLFPGALDLERFWDLLTSGRDPKRSAPPDRWRLDVVHSLSSDHTYRRDAVVGGFLTDFQYDWKRHKVPPKQIANADPLQFMLLEATDQAMRDAGYDKKEFDRTRTGVVVGTEFGGDFACQLHMGLRLPETKEFLFDVLATRGITGKVAENIVQGYASSLLSQWTALQDETGSFTASTLASRLAKTWDVMGGAAAIDSGSTSAMTALSVSFNALLVGDCDTMICAAGQRRMAWPEFEMLHRHGMLAAERPVRSPLDSEATGVVPGEGVGALVLKRLSQARQDGDRIRAVIRGVRAAHAPSWGDALKLAMERAFQTANVAPAEASCMEFDGAGPQQQTHEQLHAVASYFGQDVRRQPLLISSVTSQIGHTHGASGMASLIKANMELERGEMSALVGFDRATPMLAQEPSQITTSAERTPIRHTTSDGTRIAAVSSTSRGLAYCAVIEGGEPKAIDAQQIAPASSSAETSTAVAAAPPLSSVPAASADFRICRIGASNRKELLRTLQAASSNGSLYAQATNRRFSAADRVRLAIVADSPESCQQKLQLARQHADNPAATTVLERQGIFLREPAENRPRIAFVFPGQGSQYPGMLRELVREVPVAAQAMADADQTMRRNGFPTFAQLAWSNDSTMGTEVWPTQVAVLLADHIMHAAITDLGIQAELVLGHSYGELPALLAADAWDLETAVRVTRARCEGIAEGHRPHGGMLATTATPDVIDTLIDRVEGPVYVANHNAPDQTVVGGTDEALTQIGELLRANDYQTRSIPVPCPFHTPLMHDANGPLEEAVRKANIQRPRITTFSWVTNRPVKTPCEIRSRLLAHYTTPVWYVDLIGTIAEQGATVFVEVGPNQICTHLHERILDGDGTAMVACDNPKRPGVEQLWQVRALLECIGALEDGKNGAAQPAVSATQNIQNIPQAQRGVICFDATARRRNKMRQAAMSSTAGAHSTSDDLESPPAPSANQTVSAAPQSSDGMTKLQDRSAPDTTLEISDSELASAPTALSMSQLEQFLIAFVVEQTGYPPEVVELDADLEADLGIDSIKRAQLFAELQPYFDVQASEDVTLDDFPTLRHVVDFLKDVPTRQPLTSDSTSSDEASAATLAPEPSATTAASEDSAASAADAASSTSTAESATLHLESFLINFVVEQTGYPPEVVELDADLEADLGIDSIKRAQLFAELQPYFDVQAAEDMSLDDFPTLRHVVDFLKDVPIRQPLSSDQMDSADSGPVPPSMPSDATDPTTTPSQPSTSAEQPATSAEQPATADRANDATDQLGPSPSAAGTTTNRAAPSPYQMGYRRGKQLADQVLNQLRQIADSAGGKRDTLVIPAGAIKDPARYFSADQLDELRGMADAVQVPLGNIVAYHFADGAPPAPAADVATSQQKTAKWDLDDDDPTASTTERFQLRMLPVPWPTEAPKQPQWQGPALVIGRNATANALRERLALDGVSVLQLSSSMEMNIDKTLAEFDSLWQQQAIPHLFILSGRDAEAENINEETVWDDRYRRGVLMPMLICQRWMLRAGEANLLDRCTLVSAVQLGGDFGFSGDVTAPEGGALTGLTKAIYIEKVAIAGHQGLCVKAIDAAPSESPEELAQNIIREIAAGTVDYEVAFVNGERYLQNAYPCDAAVKDYATIRRGETWVVTGGARGITAECALELGHRFGLKLHLIGTSPFPQIDPAWRSLSDAELNDLRLTTLREARRAGQLPKVAWQRIEKALEIDQTLHRLASAGVQAVYHVCDVSDRRRLADVLETIRQTDGPIDGILHGAGIDRACRFEKKTPEGVQATLGAKVVGAYNLMTLTHQDPLRHFIGFGSISGRLGSNGQADYCAASDMLCKLVTWHRTCRPACHCVAFHFHPWDDVGMASKPEVKSMLRVSNGPVPMPKREGVRQFLRELYAGTPCSEVLVTSREYYERFYGNPTESLRQKVEEASPSPNGRVETPAESEGDRLTRRLVLRMSEAPLNRAVGVAPGLDGAAVIVGDNPAALALRDRLQAFGASVFILEPSDDREAAVNELNRLWEQNPISHLFLMTPHDGDAAVGTDEVLFPRRCNCGVLVPFVLCQQWIRLLKKASLLDQATLYACTALGGDFGILGNIAAVESGGLTGLIKSLHMEFAHNLPKGIKLKAIDFAPQETPQAMALAICNELANATPDLEVGYAGGERRVVEMVSQPLAGTQRRQITKRGTWVVTGGARGVTAVAALAVGQRFGLRLHLLGTSPPPQIEDSWRKLSEKDLQQLKTAISREAHEKGQPPRQAWKQVEKALEIDRSLRAFREAGVRATYHCCDVTDRGQLSEVLDRIRASDGPIEGIIHGAGIAVDARFQNKKHANVLNTIMTKVGGAANLIALTAADPLRFFVGFGSVAGRFGAKGQSDYAAANDMLCKQIDQLRMQRPDCVAIGIHWHAWDEVGMAVQPDVKAIFDGRDYRLMPTREGVAHLIDELTMGGTEAEVTFTDAPQLGKRRGPSNDAPPDEIAGGASDSLAPGRPGVELAKGLPMIGQVNDYHSGRQLTIETRLDPRADPFLVDHKMGDRPLLPAVIGMELCAEAASLLDDRQVVGLRDVRIHAPLPFANDDCRVVRVTVAANEAGAGCELTSDLFDRKGRLVEADRLLMSATAELADAALDLSIPHCGLPWIKTFYPFAYDDRRAVMHGPRFQSLKGVYYQHDGGFARVVTPPLSEIAGARGERGWHLPPAPLDACLLGCSTYGLFMFEGRVGLPLVFERIRFASLPRAGEECVVRIYYRGQKDKETFYDFNVFGADQRVLLTVEGFHTTVIPTWTHTFDASRVHMPIE